MIKALDGAFYDVAQKTDVWMELPHPYGRPGDAIQLRRALHSHHRFMLRFGLCKFVYFPGKFGDEALKKCNIYA